MKLRNLIFALFLVIGAIGFVSCTGDDGEAGPAGPAGPAGEPGDPGDSGDASGTYSFLTSWGSETGTVTCGDDLLEGSGPLPGGSDAATGKLSDPMPAGVNPAPLTAACNAENAGMFNTLEVADVNAISDLDLATDPEAFADTIGLVFIKTGKGAAAAEVINVPMTEFNPATQVTTNKTFVRGQVFAELNFSGSQGLERLDLYSQCGIGTSPGNVVGTWQAVRIHQSAQPYADGLPVDQDTTDDGVQPLAPTITTKICVTLDAHPGVTKCYVNVTGDLNPANNGTRIALYDGAELHTVVATPQAASSPAAVDLFATDDIADTVNLCSLFAPADPS